MKTAATLALIGLAVALVLALTGTGAHAQGRCCAERGAPTTCNPC